MAVVLMQDKVKHINQGIVEVGNCITEGNIKDAMEKFSALDILLKSISDQNSLTPEVLVSLRVVYQELEKAIHTATLKQASIKKELKSVIQSSKAVKVYKSI
ncbi:hypothetical protein [Pseudoalteromonas sp. M8]|uniref:hypothetical protein n=1 Tax=Pseudoalteromonas sp. M8 TaxID=2692624 RepID=UPI001BA526D3|nr:hypothetical protein [Pseudoalteromonas sp. M8]QUI70386.1 hypothetical protein GSF13_11685 [Pseudoalteromonas sp. M8]